MTIPFDPAVITPAIGRAIREGRFEAEESRQIPHIVRPGDRVLEIGAGIGFISTLIARQRRMRLDRHGFALWLQEGKPGAALQCEARDLGLFFAAQRAVACFVAGDHRREAAVGPARARQARQRLLQSAPEIGHSSHPGSAKAPVRLRSDPAARPRRARAAPRGPPRGTRGPGPSDGARPPGRR